MGLNFLKLTLKNRMVLKRLCCFQKSCSYTGRTTAAASTALVRIKKWAKIKEEKKYLRVILLEDGETIHNAFFDRNFKEV